MDSAILPTYRRKVINLCLKLSYIMKNLKHFSKPYFKMKVGLKTLLGIKSKTTSTAAFDK
jgi:hypothetical protein